MNIRDSPPKHSVRCAKHVPFIATEMIRPPINWHLTGWSSIEERTEIIESLDKYFSTATDKKNTTLFG